MIDDKKIEKMSPMMKHFVATKEKYKDTILLYRLGDFYELFFEDAELCSRVLGLTLTGKDCGLEKRAPMCGIPVKALEPYTIKLIENGYKVAICEQLTEPGQNGKGIVERDVVRVITPGTVIDSEMLDEKTNCYIASIYKEKENIGISYIDITIGDFYTTEFSGTNSTNSLNDFLVMVSPTLFYVVTAVIFGNPDFGPIVGGYLGIVFLSACFASIGVFASSITKNQIIAFFTAFIICIVLTMIDSFLVFLPTSFVDFFAYISANAHFTSISKGIIDTRDLLYFASITALFFVITVKIQQKERK